MAQYTAELEELAKNLPSLPMDRISRHDRGDHRDCSPPCPHWGFDIRPVPIFMEIWLESSASSII